MSDNRHIRITRIWADVSVQMILSDYINDSERVLIFPHAKDSGAARDHIHAFFFGLKTKPDTIRERLRKYVPGKMDLSVKTRAGRKNDLEITDEGAYNYASRDGIISPVFTKGYTEDEIRELQSRAELKREEIKKVREETVIYSIREVVKVDKVYIRLCQEAHAIPENDRKNMTLTDWKKWIVLNYLKAGKPAPRTADGNRYAYSIYMSYKYDLFKEKAMDIPLYELTLDYNN